MDALDCEVIFGSPGGRIIGCEGEVLPVVESTMDTARRRAAAQAPDGYVVLAERQRSGRGRAGGWECPAREGLLMSVVLRLGIARAERKLLSLMGAVAAAEALQFFGPDVRIKWPNDLVIAEKGEGLHIRKMGGVMVEQCAQGDAAPAHVLGIGVNLCQDRRRLPADTPLPATSLKAESEGRAVDRSQVCVRVLERLDFWYGKLRLGYQEALLARWRTLSCLLGETVRAEVDGRLVAGTVLGLRATGELILDLGSGDELLLTSERARLLFGSGRQRPPEGART